VKELPTRAPLPSTPRAFDRKPSWPAKPATVTALVALVLLNVTSPGVSLWM
jgi:hypothetical protein